MKIFKKLILLSIALTALWGNAYACGGWDDFDSGYHNLFSQEIMKDPLYRPFLLTYESRYYPGDTLLNGNIEEWQQYLGLSYDDTKYLVFKSLRSDLQNLTKGKSAEDPKLAFATPEFVQQHKQALLYLAYAKYLEPYMRVIPGEDSDWYWDLPEYEHNAGDLDYAKVKNVLTKSWNAESDNELKLRYGYQLVRLAHYTRRFEEAVQLFDQYVEPLKTRTEMYYYALSQKAGALRGMGETERANREFIHVFTNSRDLKTVAYSSMIMGFNDVNFADFVADAADDNERNEIYFMMGYGDFNNPVNEIEKIVANNPDAIQAKVLMVRTINMIERRLLNTYFLDEEGENARYPFFAAGDTEDKEFFNQALRLSDKQCGKASDKNFWNLVSSYLHFLNHDFDQSGNLLGKVKSDDDLYMTMVRNLTAYIDICRQPAINADNENRLFAQYHDIFTHEPTSTYCFNSTYNTFVDFVLANRYKLQGENAKSFLVFHSLEDIQNYPNEQLLEEIQAFLHKSNKTTLEDYIADLSTWQMEISPDHYIAYVKGVLRLTAGDFTTAKECFDQQTRLKVSRRIFGHNIQVWFSGEEAQIMREDYISEFPFIRNNMTEAEVTAALMRLHEIGQDDDNDHGAKANYLIGNFFYNVSSKGYFRHYLRFDNNNGYNDAKFGDNHPYDETLELSDRYLSRAMAMANDPELIAHIVFAQAKNAQASKELTNTSTWGYTIVLPEEQYNEFDQYAGTAYRKVVLSNCLYYRDFHN